MQEAEEEDAYSGYEDVDIPEMQQILPAKTAAAAKASRETGKAAVPAEIKEDPQPEAEQKASHQLQKPEVISDRDRAWDQKYPA